MRLAGQAAAREPKGQIATGIVITIIVTVIAIEITIVTVMVIIIIVTVIVIIITIIVTVIVIVQANTWNTDVWGGGAYL